MALYPPLTREYPCDIREAQLCGPFRIIVFA
jgi:hypothetical protein